MKPVIVLTFSNDQDNYLHMINRERKNIFKALQKHQYRDYFQVHQEKSTSLEDLFKLFNKYRDRIVIFHYGGHAGGTHLQLESDTGEPQTAHAVGLAQLLGQQKQLQLVFLNGCATSKQVELLLSAGVGAVIATSVPIQDEMATKFAEHFYNALAGDRQVSIQEAFDTAKGSIVMEYGTAAREIKYYRRVIREKTEKTPNGEIPWGLYYDKNRPKILQWKLPTIIQVLREDSKEYYDLLRNSRYQFLNISDIILPRTENKWLETNAQIDQIPGSLPIVEVLPSLWKRKVKHAVILGEGGMGKTVSLIYWWKKLLEPVEQPVPVFIALNEFNHPEGKREGFILEKIKKHYGQDKVRTDEIEAIMKTPLQDGDDFLPSMVLLLDGFNEITVEKRRLLIELNRLVEQCPGIQIVMTSRYDMRGNFNWSHWNLVNLQELTEDQMAGYLKGQSQVMPNQERLKKLLRNPMMLTLYAATCEVQENHKDSSYCFFKDTVESAGELLWNFIEAQVAKLPERLGLDEKKIAFYKFLLKFILPALAFEMEKAGQFEFSKEKLGDEIDKYCKWFHNKIFFSVFTEYRKNIKDLKLGECPNLEDEIDRSESIINIITKDLSMLVEEGQSLRFLHQNFRDFFATVHVLNELEVSIRKKDIPAVLKERVLDYYVRRMAGEIEGEHYAKPYLVKDQGWKIDIDKENRLHRVLDLCRGKFGEGVGYTVWNIVTIWKEVRGELSGADLSRLDLSGVGLNGVRCNRFYEDRHLVYLAAVFDGSRIHEKNLLPQGHSNFVYSAVYSPDGKKILSASDDQTIKEWDAGTGEWLKTLTGHSAGVNRAVYSLNRKKILSASADRTIKEWDAGTGKCIRNLIDHKLAVNWVMYNSKEEKILSASDDNTIKEWDTETGKCCQTLIGNNNIVKMTIYTAVYSPNEDRILTASIDNNIKEYNVTTGKCYQTFFVNNGRLKMAMYSPDGRRILSSSDQTIKEWYLDTRFRVNTLDGHSGYINSAVYSPNGEKILSASTDQTIKEWDVSTGKCIQTLVGHLDYVNTAVYSPDGKKILSSSQDCSIKEWNVNTGECVNTISGRLNYVRTAKYNANNKKFLSCGIDHSFKEWDVMTRKCIKILIADASHLIKSVAYNSDEKKFYSFSENNIAKMWSVATGECLEILKNPENIKDLPPNDISKKAKKFGNRIYLPDINCQGEHELIDIPGLFIQGCSFQNLEKGSQWTPEGLAILKQYNAQV